MKSTKKEGDKKPTALATARKFGVSRKTLYEWVKDGCPQNADGTFSVEDVLAWKQAKLGLHPSVQRAATKSEAEIKKLGLQCEKLAVEIDVTKGKLLLADDVRREVTRIFQTVKQRFLALPNESAPLLAGLSSAEAEKLLRERVTKILDAMSDHEWMQTAK